MLNVKKTKILMRGKHWMGLVKISRQMESPGWEHFSPELKGVYVKEAIVCLRRFLYGYLLSDYCQPNKRKKRKRRVKSSASVATNGKIMPDILGMDPQ